MHIKDSQGHVFATRLNYVFVIGKVGYISLVKYSFTQFLLQGTKPFISLPKGKGVKLTIAEERDKRLGVKA